MPPSIRPILRFLGSTNTDWSISAIIEWNMEDPPILNVDGQTPIPSEILRHPDKERRVLRYVFTVQRPTNDTVKKVEYTLGDGNFAFHVPAKKTDLKIGYFSCNGFSSGKVMKGVEEPNERWTDLLESHKESPFHLLLGGGDQIYTDSMWDRLLTLRTWLDLSEKRRLAAKFNARMQREVWNFYWDVYTMRWDQNGPREALQSIPTMMMWDDHDIFDGWGSYASKLHKCEVYQGIFKIAREFFKVFQLHCADRNTGALEWLVADGANDSYGAQVDKLALLVLDLRTERTISQVLSESAWDGTYKWLDKVMNLPDESKPDHLLVMLSIPLVYPSFSLIEKTLDIIPGRQELEDDLKDHWTSREHQEERLRLIHRLFGFAEKNIRVTILSGDVHNAALGVLKNDRAGAIGKNWATINQLISSGIVHPSAPGLVKFYLNKLADHEEEPDRDIHARMLPMPASGGRAFLFGRNWLSLDIEAQKEKRIWARWHIEKGDADPNKETVITKVIHNAK